MFQQPIEPLVIIQNQENEGNSAIISGSGHNITVTQNSTPDEPYYITWNRLTRNLKEIYMEKMKLITPFNWIPERNIRMKDHFVDFEIEQYNYKKEKISASKSKDLEMLITGLRDSGHPIKRILLKGEIGSGKTTLCQKLSYDWSMEVPYISAIFSLVIMFRLRNLKMNQILEDELIKGCNYNAQNQNVEPILKDNSKNTLLLLDGYDELPIDSRSSVNKLLQFSDLFRDAKIIVTSRTFNTDKSCFVDYDRQATIVGMSVENQKKFVEILFENSKMYSKLMGRLKWSRFWFTNNMYPLMLFILCYLETNEQLNYKQCCSCFKSVSEEIFLENTCRFLAEKCVFRLKLKWLERDIEKAYNKLGRLFYSVNGEHESYFNLDNKGFSEDEKRFASECGILRMQGVNANTDIIYKPTHSCFIEYLTKMYTKQIATRENR